MSQLQISKLDAARRQLETAVLLYFHEGDPVSIHTLAGAAYDVLRDVGKDRGASGMYKDWVADYVKPDCLKHVRDALNAPQNFLKHADRDPASTLSLDTRQGEFLLLDGCWAYRRLAGERLALLGVFDCWSSITWARHLVKYDGMEEFLATDATGLVTLSRHAFFEKMLPVAYLSGLHLPKV